jgi:heterodisulfide reductase subunit B2
MADKYGLFLGCIAPLRYPGIEKATREVCEKLGMDLVDLDGATCCPAPGVIRSFNKATWLAVAARNLALAEKIGVDIVTICNGCFGSLFDANHELIEDPELRKEVNGILSEIGMEYNGGIKVRHFAEVFYNDIGLDKIKENVTKPLDYKVAVHYGCHFAKPSNIRKLDDPERPHIVDDLVEVTGAKSVPYRDKQMCCGAGGGVRSGAAEVALKMTEEKLKNIQAVGADFILDVCPFCHLQFDRGQKDLKGYDIPVLHLSQLYGLAFGMPIDSLGLEAQVVPFKA